LIENISGVETFKAYGAGRQRAEEANSRLVRLTRSVFSMQMLNMSMGTTGSIVNGAAGLIVLWYGGHRVIEGALTIGELMFFYTLLGYMLAPLERLASVNLQIQDALVAMDRLHQIMDLETDDADSRKAVVTNVSHAVELRDVSFRYGCRDIVLDQLQLEIPAGGTMAIVGESGCGKSTVLKLLMRFYDPTSGCILIDGVDMRDLSLESLRSAIGFVSQDPFIMSGSVRDNIALGRPEASLNEIIQAAQAAGLDGFIAELPDRYETIIGERGANLSGGRGNGWPSRGLCFSIRASSCSMKRPVISTR
jgi:ATP-binding cassette subfamily B protein